MCLWLFAVVAVVVDVSDVSNVVVVFLFVRVLVVFIVTVVILVVALSGIHGRSQLLPPGYRVFGIAHARSQKQALLSPDSSACVP